MSSSSINLCDWSGQIQRVGHAVKLRHSNGVKIFKDADIATDWQPSPYEYTSIIVDKLILFPYDRVRFSLISDDYYQRQVAAEAIASFFINELEKDQVLASAGEWANLVTKGTDRNKVNFIGQVVAGKDGFELIYTMFK